MHVNFSATFCLKFHQQEEERGKNAFRPFRLVRLMMNNVTAFKHFFTSKHSFLQSNPYGLKDSGPTSDMSWTTAGLQPTTGYYSPYDPTLAAYG